MNVKNGVIGFLKDWGIEVDVVKSNKLKIKAYDGAIVFKHAVSDVKE